MKPLKSGRRGFPASAGRSIATNPIIIYKQDAAEGRLVEVRPPPRGNQP